MGPGRTKKCAVPGCRSDSRYSHKDHMIGVTFNTFPKLKTKPLQCLQWVKWLANYRSGFRVEDVKPHTYICSKHNNDGLWTTNAITQALSQSTAIVSGLDKERIAIDSEQPPLLREWNSTCSTVVDTHSIVSQSVSYPNSHLLMDHDYYILPVVHGINISDIHVNVSQSLVSDAETEKNLEDTSKLLKAYDDGLFKTTEVSTQTVESIFAPQLSILKTPNTIKTEAVDEVKPESFPICPNAASVSVLRKERIPGDPEHPTLTMNCNDITQLETHGNVSQNFESQNLQLLMDETDMLNNHVHVSKSFVYDSETEKMPVSMFEETSKSLKDIFGKFTVPDRWLFSLTNESLTLCQINFNSGSVLVMIHLDENFNLTLKVLNKSMEGHPLLTDVAATIDSDLKLEELLKRLQKVNICSGTTEPKYKDIFKETNEYNAYTCAFTKSIRHTSCSIISHVKRCGFCKKLRVYYRSVISRRKCKTTPTRMAPMNKLSQAELIKELKKSKTENISLQSKIKRLKNKTTKLLKKQGNSVSEDTDDD